MQQARDSFDIRVEEIGYFLSFIEEITIHQGALQLSIVRPREEGGQRAIETVVKPIRSTLLDTMKANAFLLIYNLIESTFRQSLEAVGRYAERHDHSYDVLSGKMQMHLLKQLKSDSVRKDVIEKHNSDFLLSSAIIKAGLSASLTDGGNITYRYINEFAKTIGLNAGEEPKVDFGSKFEPLFHVKERRNDLAHGHLSFMGCGGQVTIDQLKVIRDEVVKYLAQYLDNVELFLESKAHLKESMRPQPPAAQPAAPAPLA